MVAFGLIGIFVIKAAIDYAPKKAVGLDGALAKLAHQSYGTPFCSSSRPGSSRSASTRSPTPATGGSRS